MNERGGRTGEAASFVIGWGLVTVVFRYLDMAPGGAKGWIACAGMAALTVASGELSERWHRYRRRKKSRAALGS
ncbi:hypothetical protein ACFV06_27060 [Streptomyces sp. NPDC059618]|uniref:hypothetical protein n=1 Tax=Streptomyces sp. NPDC059618 TaxID=3346887 RepID=UPI003688CF41